mgnify:CR=1 FL=1
MLRERTCHSNDLCKLPIASYSVRTKMCAGRSRERHGMVAKVSRSESGINEAVLGGAWHT